MPTAVVTFHFTGLDVHWGLPQLLHLRVLDITLTYWTDPMSTEDVRRRLHSILVSPTSPALEHMRLVLWSRSYIILSGQDIYSRDATTHADREQDTDMHATLARLIFASLDCVTVVLYGADREGSAAEKDVALKLLGFLRMLFAPWCVRGIVSLACVARASTRSLDVVVDKGEGPPSIKESGWDYGSLKELLADLGLWQHLAGKVTTTARELDRTLQARQRVGIDIQHILMSAEWVLPPADGG